MHWGLSGNDEELDLSDNTLSRTRCAGIPELFAVDIRKYTPPLEMMCAEGLLIRQICDYRLLSAIFSAGKRATKAQISEVNDGLRGTSMSPQAMS